MGSRSGSKGLPGAGFSGSFLPNSSHRSAPMLTPILVALGLTAGSGTETIPVFDGRLRPKPAAATPAEVALLKKEVLPAARKAAAGEGCDEQFEILDAAQGSFTREGAPQRIVLYRYCTAGHDMGRSGLVVIESDKVVAHLAVDGTSQHAIGVLRDLDGDGRAELVIASGGGNTGELWEVASIVSWSGSGVRKLGFLQAYHDDCGGAGKGREAHRLFAVPGPKPSFLRQAFIGPCEGEEWTKRGGQAPVVPDEDGSDWVLLGRWSG